MAFHSKPLEHFILKHQAGATTAFFVMLVVAVAALITAVLIWRACKIEKARLSCELINQMESTSRAERRSRSKSTAFTDASHEIRGPLALLITYIDLCYDLVPSGSDVEDNLRKMHTCANNLLKLLNTILDISKVEAGKMELEDDEFNLVELMETVADLYHPTAMKKGVEVVLDLCDGSVLKYANVRGDKTRLQQIISNLVSNAVKFTPKGSISIRVWARKPSPEPCCMLVSHHQSNWLNWLHQIARLLPEFGGISTLRTIGKLGIGHQNSEIGNKEAECNTSGSEEILTMRERQARSADQKKVVCREMRAGLMSGDHMLQPLTGLRIMVAEDTKMLATLVYKLLSMLGAVVYVVEDGKQALDAVLQGLNNNHEQLLPFDLILMDCEMPVMSGFEATREIRKAEKHYGVHIPIVALSAHISPDRIKETKLAGMDEYLAKPANKETLVKTITQLVVSASDDQGCLTT
ncbi:hypothetical protein QQ045_025169 [Rhodiola kirilowii]